MLGVSRSASKAEVKAAYRSAALKLHPDVSDAADANERFSELSSAYGAPSASWQGFGFRV